VLNFIREESWFILTVLSWVVVALYLGPVTYVFLPLTLLMMRSRDHWAEMIMGLLIVLVLSDMHRDLTRMGVFKNVKDVAVLVLAWLFMRERQRFSPLAGVFPLFLPFFLYAVFPLVFSNRLPVATMKTVSYALMFLIVPNYVLHSYRTMGWTFFRNLMFFIASILLAGLLMQYLVPKYAFVGGRFNGLFGNPNGMGIFCFLVFILMSVLASVKKDLFTWLEQAVIYGVIGYFLLKSGSRASLAAVMIFLVFHRFFAYSPFLGFVVLVLIIGVGEAVARNFSVIVVALGLEEYFRLRTLEGGSGRYFAWEFAWDKINQDGYLIFGGGFGNDEYVMRRNYAYLERMGHQGGVHNSYLSMWFNMGIIGLLIYLRSFFLLFIKAAKLAPMSIAVMFSVMFSIMYESWLVASLNPYTIVLLMIMTVVSEEEITNWEGIERGRGEDAEPTASAADAAPRPVPVF